LRGVWLLCAIEVGFGLAVFARSQAAPPVNLTGELRAHVQAERFQLVTSIRGLPLGVRSELQTLFGSPGLDIADPGEEFQASGASGNTNLPIRRLVAAGCSYEHCLVYYERGGGARTWRAALFHWTPAATRLEWGGVAPGGLATFDDVRRLALSGAIESPAGVW
jgi:hypothetical protein